MEPNIDASLILYPDEMKVVIAELKARGKTSIMVVVAEGDENGGAEIIHRQLTEAGCPYPTRVLTLGHLQRGGSPVPADRILATRLGDFAVRSIIAGHNGVMAGQIGDQTLLTPFAETYASHKPVPDELVALLETMAV